MEGDKLMANMKNRNLKVIAQSGYQYQSVPAIRLCGKWLQSVGFNIGDFISVRCEDGKLIIEPDVERARMEEAEKAFMDRELKSLQKRLEAEKEKLHAQFVAERSAEYGVTEREV
jgi:antitoxin component of MazEF toxin-antitoxin module